MSEGYEVPLSYRGDRSYTVAVSYFVVDFVSTSILFTRNVWCMVAAKMDDGVPWHKGVFQGAENFMSSWHKEEEEASRRRAAKRGSEGSTTDLEPPIHF